jgi:hypothetical protein
MARRIVDWFPEYPDMAPERVREIVMAIGDVVDVHDGAPGEQILAIALEEVADGQGAPRPMVERIARELIGMKPA